MRTVCSTTRTEKNIDDVLEPNLGRREGPEAHDDDDAAVPVVVRNLSLRNRRKLQKFEPILILVPIHVSTHDMPSYPMNLGVRIEKSGVT